MAGERITSLQVAERAGVSQSAVSRVFTPGASASERTIKKVKKAAAELGYRPNVLARSLITGRSRIIGLVVAYLNNQFYPEALERLSKVLQERGYHVLVFTASNTEGNIEKVVDEILDYQVDGIILASVALSSDLAARAQAAGVPVVLFNRGQDGVGVSSITSANIKGGELVAKHFIESGRKRIAHISGWMGSSTGRDRASGFRAGLEAGGLPLLVEKDGHFDREIAAQATREIMEEFNPDAIFVGNDHMAFSVVDVLRSEMNRSVPEDVAIVGYDDVPLASWAAYDLTTVRQPVNQMVEATVDTLIAGIGPEAPAPRKIEIEGHLIIRATSP